VLGRVGDPAGNTEHLGEISELIGVNGEVGAQGVFDPVAVFDDDAGQRREVCLALFEAGCRLRDRSGLLLGEVGEELCRRCGGAGACSRHCDPPH